MSFNVNNLYTKPAISNGTLLSDTRLTVDATVGGVQFASTFFTQDTTGTAFLLVDLDVQDADVYCTFDGSAPTTTNGHLLKQNSGYTWSKARAQAAKFIRAGGTDAKIQASPSSV